jgi:hypothetical protein
MVRSAAVSLRRRSRRGRRFARSLAALTVALGAVWLAPTAGATSFSFWQCGGPEQTSSFLAANPAASATSFLFSIDAGLQSVCFNPAVETFCPIEGLSFNWADGSGKRYQVNVNNQYSLGFAVALGAGRKFNYSCNQGTTVQGLYLVTHKQGLSDIFGCGAPPPDRGIPGNSGVLFFNGSGAAQSLFVTIDAQTGTGGPMSNFRLNWVDGSGHSRGATLNNVQSGGVALTLANAAAITYSCPMGASSVAGSWAVEPGP